MPNLEAFSSLFSEREKIEKDINHLETKIQKLPKTLPSAMPWTRGIIYHLHQKDEKVLETKIHFEQPEMIDLVVLMPSTYRDDENQLRSYGFPVRFVLQALLDDDSIETIVDYSDRDYPTPGIEPQTFSCNIEKPIQALLLRTSIHKEYPSHSNFSHFMALNEIMAFSNEQNVALNAEVIAPGHSPFAKSWSKAALVDGFGLFSPVDRKIRHPNREFYYSGTHLDLILDIGEHKEIDEIRLWPIVHLYSPLDNGIGFPKVIRVEALASASNTSGHLLYQSHQDYARPGSNPLMRKIPVFKTRFLKISLSQPWTYFETPTGLALNEIELFSKGKKIAIKNTFTFSNKKELKLAELNKLFDGRTNEGFILPLRQWIEQFVTRTNLEKEILQLKKKWDFELHQESERVKAFILIVILLFIIFLLVIWTVRLITKRKWDRVREQIACDLHDQIGANLSSLVHSNELIDRMVPNRSELMDKLLKNSIKTAQSTASEARSIVKLLQSNDKTDPLHLQLEEAASHILVGIKVDFKIIDKKILNSFHPKLKWNFLMFFKEALNNIIKHAEAKNVTIKIKHEGADIFLLVVDDGCGIPEANLPLTHLELRAKRMQGDLSIESQNSTGTSILLKINRKLWK